MFYFSNGRALCFLAFEVDVEQAKRESILAMN